MQMKLQDKFKIGIYLHLFLMFLRESFEGCDPSLFHSYKIEKKGSVWSEADQESLLFATLTNFNEIEKKKTLNLYEFLSYCFSESGMF